jgi:hypothetical protein
VPLVIASRRDVMGEMVARWLSFSPKPRRPDHRAQRLPPRASLLRLRPAGGFRIVSALAADRRRVWERALTAREKRARAAAPDDTARRLETLDLRRLEPGTRGRSCCALGVLPLVAHEDMGGGRPNRARLLEGSRMILRSGAARRSRWGRGREDSAGRL